MYKVFYKFLNLIFKRYSEIVSSPESYGLDYSFTETVTKIILDFSCIIKL